MSTKDAAIEIIRNLPAETTLEGIVAALQVEQATVEALRRFDERGGIPDEDVTDEEWMAMICRSWADDLNDPRQDIYTLGDGAPDHESR